MIRRKIHRSLCIDLEGNNAAFLWGPRKVGKTTLLHDQFPDALHLDLLQSDLRTDLMLRPHHLRERVRAEQPRLVILDEVQKVPALLDEVHWCLENTATKFVLCRSSARKLRRGAANLLGGRAWRFELHPLTTDELVEHDLLRIVNHGLLPKHYLEARPERSLKGYLADYVQEEIQAEALVRNVPAFARFLEAMGTSHGELLNYANVARDCGVSAKTVKEYYQILEDTLLGFRLPAWRNRRKRRLIETSKFYLFDVGLARAICGMRVIQDGSFELGRAFEHFVVHEIRAYLAYRDRNQPMAFWRTSAGLEVDVIVGDMELALECKASHKVDERDCKGLNALIAEHSVGRVLIVCQERHRRTLDNGVEVWPWADFCQALWAGQFL